MKNNIDNLINQSLFSSDLQLQKNARSEIRKIANEKGIYLASINNLYKAFGEKKFEGFTIPAINVRTLTYETSQLIFEIIKQKNIGAVIFEIAKSEIEYTCQRPDEFVTSILAGAITANYKGPVFIQGDHFQFSANKFKENKQQEIDKIKNLIKESIGAGFYNIDIDASTLVELDKENLSDQQKNNFEMTAEMTKFIRQIEPKNITVSIGGEIGHIGGKNSTPEDFIAFIEGYKKLIDNNIGISKVSVQTGTSHGGIPLADGTIAKIKLDFEVLSSIAQIAQDKYQIGGPVQHGASTLPKELFGEFPKKNTIEIHLATGFQNIIYDNMPKELKEKIYNWLKENCAKEKKTDETDEQFLYKTRKKGLGQFKKEISEISDIDKNKILLELKKEFEFIFEKLNIFETKNKIENYV